VAFVPQATCGPSFFNVAIGKVVLYAVKITVLPTTVAGASSAG